MSSADAAASLLRGCLDDLARLHQQDRRDDVLHPLVQTFLETLEAVRRVVVMSNIIFTMDCIVLLCNEF